MIAVNHAAVLARTCWHLQTTPPLRAAVTPTPTAAAAASTPLPSSRPTHFVALRLPDPGLHEQMRRVQAELIAAEPRAAGCGVPPEKSHLTAFVLTLHSQADIERAQQALRECAALLPGGPHAPHIRVRGLGAFGRDVVFAAVEPGHELGRIGALVEASARLFVDRCGMAAAAHLRAGQWTAHLTLLKTSRVRSRRRPKPCLPTIHTHRDVDFGTHGVWSLELCAMVGRGEAGYYPVLESVLLGAPSAADGGGQGSSGEDGASEGGGGASLKLVNQLLILAGGEGGGGAGGGHAEGRRAGEGGVSVSTY
mmetsp:Transcript_19991/g.46118  ORF Transcript_19991/g.46118 Transcript_19991/m.46118 type:complete len:309 (-) Transcript_19991:1-927(-)